MSETTLYMKIALNYTIGKSLFPSYYVDFYASEWLQQSDNSLIRIEREKLFKVPFREQRIECAK